MKIIYYLPKDCDDAKLRLDLFGFECRILTFYTNILYRYIAIPTYVYLYYQRLFFKLFESKLFLDPNFMLHKLYSFPLWKEIC